MYFMYIHTTDQVYPYKLVTIISLSVLALTTLILVVLVSRVTVFWIRKRQGQSHYDSIFILYNNIMTLS